MNTAREQLAYLQSIEGQQPASVDLKMAFTGKGEIPLFLRAALVGRLVATLQAVIINQQGSLEAAVKVELREEIRLAQLRLDELRAQLAALRSDTP